MLATGKSSTKGTCASLTSFLVYIPPDHRVHTNLNNNSYFGYAKAVDALHGFSQAVN